jgi:hypothetical protein
MNDETGRPLILPLWLRGEIKSHAAKRGLQPEDLVDEVMEQAKRKGPAYEKEMGEIAQAICDARALGIPALWPETFEDRVVVCAILSIKFELGSEDALLETSGPEMDAIEAICRIKGISYEELMIEGLLAKQNGEGPDDGEGEEWKQ